MLNKLILSAAILLSSFASYANEFSAAISPPRFELKSKKGELNKGVIEITNVGTSSAVYKVKTNDWFFSEDYNINFSDDLLENSCRDWVYLESENVSILPGQTKKYRFNVKVPNETIINECKFVILIEGADNIVKSGEFDIPIASRVGVIVYLSLDGSEPKFDILNITKKEFKGSLVPLIDVINNGSSHGRLNGFIDVVDSNNKKYVLMPESIPVLPSYKRSIMLIPQPKTEDEKITLSYPIKIKGDLYWEGGKLNIDKYLE